ncbi:DUF4034 domain-containing protein [Massilia sp. CCM 8733]|uniref:DUF4034 domain-containing protein n=1 Tax=Massilia mucilaginosa TaxID=2609282 RepID=A0ABX0NZ69_9BURK|nr:DUF4034 domain-containing protein [Massilia mucilaginosa]NHZ92230.1 DUF4034 domain-containing protein [Massilia mucilaginosa]
MTITLHRMAIIPALAGLLLFSAQPVHACVENPSVRPADLEADAVNRLFLERNYKQLDQLYQQYSTKRSTTPDGMSALSIFFRGIAKSFVGCTSSQRTEQEWKAQQASLAAWQAASPKSNGPKLALALNSVNYGWYARGRGVSSTVSGDARSVFESRMEDARHQFDKLGALAKHNPAWYSGMLQIGLAQGWRREKFEPMYASAVKLDPYYMNFHVVNKEYHDQKWYGSDQEMHQAVNTAVELTKDRFGQALYARLYTTEWKPRAMFTTGGVSWERMKKGFEDDLAIHPDLPTRRDYANYACVADDANTLKQQLDLLGDQADIKSWGNNQHIAYCTGLATMSGTDRKPKCFKFTGTEDYICD